MTSSSDIPLKRSTFLFTFLKLSSIFSCLPSAGASATFLGLGPGLAFGALGSLGGFGALGTFGGLGSLGWAGLPLFLAGATEREGKAASMSYRTTLNVTLVHLENITHSNYFRKSIYDFRWWTGWSNTAGESGRSPLKEAVPFARLAGSCWSIMASGWATCAMAPWPSGCWNWWWGLTPEYWAWRAWNCCADWTLW